MVEMWSTIPYNASLVDAVDMVVSPRHIKHVKDYLSCSGMTPIVIEDNLQRAIEAENEVNPEDQEGEVSFLDLTRKGYRCAFTGMTWSKYHRYNTIDSFVKCLATEFPDKAERFTIGHSYEGKKNELTKDY